MIQIATLAHRPPGSGHRCLSLHLHNRFVRVSIHRRSARRARRRPRLSEPRLNVFESPPSAASRRRECAVVKRSTAVHEHPGGRLLDGPPCQGGVCLYSNASMTATDRGRGSRWRPSPGSPKSSPAVCRPPLQDPLDRPRMSVVQDGLLPVRRCRGARVGVRRDALAYECEQGAALRPVLQALRRSGFSGGVSEVRLSRQAQGDLVHPQR